MADIKFLELPAEQDDNGVPVTPFAVAFDSNDEPASRRVPKRLAAFRKDAGLHGLSITTYFGGIPGTSADDDALYVEGSAPVYLKVTPQHDPLGEPVPDATIDEARRALADALAADDDEYEDES